MRAPLNVESIEEGLQMGTWWKTFESMKETEEENRETNKNILAPWGSWWVSSEDYVAGEKPPNPMMARLRRKTGQEINQWKTFKLDEEMWEENQKIIVIVDEKTFQSGWKTGKKKPRLMERGGVCLRKDLDNKGLGQNKVLYSSLGVELLMVNYYAGFPALARKTDLRLPASFWL